MQGNRGFVAILSLLIGTAIVVLLFVKFYFTPKEQTGEMWAVQPISADGTTPTTDIG